jgi:hypothetical protein
MARQRLEAFGEGTEVVRVYLAAGLDEAQAVEEALGAAGLTYAVEVESFATRTLLGFGGLREGAGFWIVEGDLEAAAGLLERAGLIRGLVDRG